MTIYLVWTGYEEVEAAFFKKEDAEQWIKDYIVAHPTWSGHFSITDIEVK